MKRPIRRKWGTNSRRPASDRGSVSLETALVMPVFLMLVFFLFMLVQASIVMMALHGAVSQTVRLTAAAWYPVSLIQADVREGGGTEASSDSSMLSGARESLGALGRWLPAPLNEWAQALSTGEWSPEAEVAKMPIRQLVLKMADSRVLDADRLRVTEVNLPKSGNFVDAYLTVKAEYRLPVRWPWNGQPLKLHASAKERVWVGGSPSRATLPVEGSSLPITFVSLEPDPVRPGHKATLVLQTEPGASLDLSVIYKSGQSQAKHLGNAVADESGRVSWTWHVSGNTTSGEWTWVVRGEGGASYTQTFKVERNTS